MIRHHCSTEEKKRDKSEERTRRVPWCLCDAALQLTDRGEDVGETEVIDGVERQQMIEKLFLLIIAAQKGVTLIELPATKERENDM